MNTRQFGASRVQSIEVADGEEHIKLACAPCGTEATQSTKLPD
jgi:hypothetical protein